jgi:non-ribosomal peptide synthetase component F
VFQPAAAQDVALWFLDGVDGVVGGLNYNTDILAEDTARRLAQRFLALVAAIAAHPERPLRELLALAPDERAQLDQWNATAQPLPAAADLASYVAPAWPAIPPRSRSATPAPPPPTPRSPPAAIRSPPRSPAAASASATSSRSTSSAGPT